MSGPLNGYRVIDATQMLSGPMATMMLGDQGADVVKIEPPNIGDLTRALGGKGRGVSPFFSTLNRNKRSVVLNLKDKNAIELLKQLVSGADVFVQNFRPGAAERMGIGEEVLRKVKPNLIYVSISGFGEKGPYTKKRVYDPVIQALSGLTDIQSDPVTGRPRMMRLIIPDKVTALTAAQAITAALLSRERTGEGQHVRLAMLDAVVSFLWHEGMAQYTFMGPDIGAARPPDTRDLVFETKDGFITAAAVSDKEWQGLVRALERPNWLEDKRFSTPAGRVKYADIRLEMTADVLRTRNSEEWLERLDAEQVPCAPINRKEDVLNDPQVIANELIVESLHPHAGQMRQARPAARFEKTPSELLRQPAPLLGEQTNAVLSELGVSPDRLAALREAGTIG